MNRTSSLLNAKTRAEEFLVGEKKAPLFFFPLHPLHSPTSSYGSDGHGDGHGHDGDGEMGFLFSTREKFSFAARAQKASESS